MKSTPVATTLPSALVTARILSCSFLSGKSLLNSFLKWRESSASMITSLGSAVTRKCLLGALVGSKFVKLLYPFLKSTDFNQRILRSSGKFRLDQLL